MKLWLRRTLLVTALVCAVVPGIPAAWAQTAPQLEPKLETPSEPKTPSKPKGESDPISQCVSDSGDRQVAVGDNQVNADTPVAVNCKGANNKDQANRASGSGSQVNVYQPVAVGSKNSNNGSQYNKSKGTPVFFFPADGNADPRLQIAFALANSSQINVHGGGVAIASQDSNNGKQVNNASSASEAENTYASSGGNSQIINQAAVASARTLQLNYSGQGVSAGSENSNQGAQDNTAAASAASATNSSEAKQTGSDESTYGFGNFSWTNQAAEADAQSCQVNVSYGTVTEACSQDKSTEDASSSSRAQQSGGSGALGSMSCDVQTSQHNEKEIQQSDPNGNTNCTIQKAQDDENASNTNRTTQNAESGQNWNFTYQKADVESQACEQETDEPNPSQDCGVESGGDIDQEASNTNQTKQSGGYGSYGAGNWNKTMQDADVDAQSCEQEVTPQPTPTSAPGSATNGMVQTCEQEAGNIDQDATNSNRTEQKDGSSYYGAGNWNSTTQNAEADAQTCEQDLNDATAEQFCDQDAGNIEQEASNSNRTKQENGDGATYGNWNETEQDATADAQTCSQELTDATGGQSCEQEAGNIEQDASNSNRTEQDRGTAGSTQKGAGAAGGTYGSSEQAGNWNRTDQWAQADAQTCSQDLRDESVGVQSCDQEARNIDQDVSNSNSTQQDEGTASSSGHVIGQSVNQTGNWNETEQDGQANAQTCSQEGTEGSEGDQGDVGIPGCVQRSGDIDQEVSNSNRTTQDEGTATYGDGTGSDVNQNGNWNRNEQDAQANAQTCSQDIQDSAGFDQFCDQQSGNIDQEASNSNRAEQEDGTATYGDGQETHVEQNGNWNENEQTAETNAQTCSQELDTAEASQGDEENPGCVQSSGDIDQEASNSNRTEQEEGTVTYGDGYGSDVTQNGNWNRTEQDARANAQTCGQEGTDPETGEDDPSIEGNQNCAQGAGDIEQEASNSNRADQDEGTASYGDGYGSTVTQNGNWNEAEQDAEANAQTCTQDVSNDIGYDQACDQSAGNIDQEASNSNRTEQEEGEATYGTGWVSEVNQTGNWNNTEQDAETNAQVCEQDLRNGEAAQTCNQRARDIDQDASNANRTEQEEGEATYAESTVCSAGLGCGGGTDVNQTGNWNNTEQDAETRTQACDQEAEAEGDVSTVATQSCNQSARNIEQEASNSNRTEQEEGEVTYGSGWGGDVNQTGNWNNTEQDAENRAQTCDQEAQAETNEVEDEALVFAFQGCDQSARGIDQDASNANRSEQEEAEATYGSGGGGEVNQTGNWNNTEQDAENRAQTCGQEVEAQAEGDAEATAAGAQACEQSARGIDQEASNSNRTEQEEAVVTYGEGWGGDVNQTGNWNNTEQDAENRAQTCDQEAEAEGDALVFAFQAPVGDAGEPLPGGCHQTARQIDQDASNSNRTEQEEAEVTYGEGWGGDVNQTGNWNNTEQEAENRAQTCDQEVEAQDDASVLAAQDCDQTARQIDQDASNSNRTEQEEAEVTYGEGWGGDVNQTGNWNNTEQEAENRAQTCDQEVEAQAEGDAEVTAVGAQACEQSARGIDQEASNSSRTEQEEAEVTYGSGWGGDVNQTGNWNNTEQEAENRAQTCDQEAQAEGDEASAIAIQAPNLFPGGCDQTARDIDQEASNSSRTEQEEGEVTYGSGWGGDVNQTGNWNNTEQEAENRAQTCDQEAQGEGEATALAFQACDQTARDIDQDASNSDRTEQEEGEATYGTAAAMDSCVACNGDEVNQTGNSNSTNQDAESTAQSCSQEVNNAGAFQGCDQSARDIDQDASNSSRTEQEEGTATYGEGGYGTTVNQTGNSNNTDQTARTDAQRCSQNVVSGGALQACDQQARDVESEASNSSRTEQEDGTATYGEGDNGTTVNQVGNDNSTSQNARARAQTCEADSASSDFLYSCDQEARDVEAEAENSNRTEQEDGTATYGDSRTRGGDVNQTGNQNSTEQSSQAIAQGCDLAASQSSGPQNCDQEARDVEAEARNSNQTEQEDGTATYGGIGNGSGSGNQNVTTQDSVAVAQGCDQAAANADVSQSCDQDARDVEAEASTSNRTEQEDGTSTYGDGNSNFAGQSSTALAQNCTQTPSSSSVTQSCEQEARDVEAEGKNSNRTEQEDGTSTYGSGNSNFTEQLSTASAQNCVQTASDSSGTQTCDQEARDVEAEGKNSNRTEQEDGTSTDGNGNSNFTFQDTLSRAQNCSQTATSSSSGEQTCDQEARDVEAEGANSNRTVQEDGTSTNGNGNSNETQQFSAAFAQLCSQTASESSGAQDCDQDAREVEAEGANSNRTVQEDGTSTNGTGSTNLTEQFSAASAQACSQNASTSSGAQSCEQEARDVEAEAENSNRTYGDGGSNFTIQAAGAAVQDCSQFADASDGSQTCDQEARDVEAEAENSNRTYGDGGSDTTIQIAVAAAQVCDQTAMSSSGSQSCDQDAREVEAEAENSEPGQIAIALGQECFQDPGGPGQTCDQDAQEVEEEAESGPDVDATQAVMASSLRPR